MKKCKPEYKRDKSDHLVCAHCGFSVWNGTGDTKKLLQDWDKAMEIKAERMKTIAS